MYFQVNHVSFRGGEGLDFILDAKILSACLNRPPAPTDEASGWGGKGPWEEAISHDLTPKGS